jgi:hypothetical protein
MRTASDQSAETLAIAGVKRIYGIVGDSLNGSTDSIRRQGKIEWLHVRHEEVAAGAEAHLIGELAVCAGSCGPGNLHLIDGLFDCHRSRVPVLADRRADSVAGDRRWLFPGNPSADALPGMQSLLRIGLRVTAVAAHPGDRHPRGGRQARRCGGG